MRTNLMIKTIATAIVLGVTPIFAQSVAEVKDALTKVDEAPVPIRTVAPQYPAELRNAQVAGLVSVLVVIDESGNVVASEVTKASRDEFKQPSLDAIQAWKFKPAKVAGHNVKVRLTVPVKFTSET
jgi:TonB family protein